WSARSRVPFRWRLTGSERNPVRELRGSRPPGGGSSELLTGEGGHWQFASLIWPECVEVEGDVAPPGFRRDVLGRFDHARVRQRDEEEVLVCDVGADRAGLVGAGEDPGDTELDAAAELLQLWCIIETRVEQAGVAVGVGVQGAGRVHELGEPLPRVILREGLLD